MAPVGVTARRSPPESQAALQADGRGEPSAALRRSVISAHIMGSPVRRLLNPITRCRDQPRNRYAGTDDGPGTSQTLDTNQLTLMCVRCYHGMEYRGMMEA
jgi:hypothetical protein